MHLHKLGWHGGTVTGIVTGITGYSGQSTVGTSSTDFMMQDLNLVEQILVLEILVVLVYIE